MKNFITCFGKKLLGVVSGFDRLVFRGYLRSLYHEAGFMAFLYAQRLLLKDFAAYSQKTTALLKEASCAVAARENRPVIHLPSARVDKEDFVRNIAQEDGVQNGLVAILTAVEPCKSWEYFRDLKMNRLRPRMRNRKCLHLYHYRIDPVFGFMHARIQTWFPFEVQVWVNGREWLGQQMDRHGLRYRRSQNCFPWIEKPANAQKLLDRQVTLDWPATLRRIARRLNPLHDRIFSPFPMEYYWTLHQSEWATDVMFRSADTLNEIVPPIVRRAMMDFRSADVMRFLGRKVNARFLGQVVTDFKNRPEGVRVKHRAGRNWVKVYNKEGSILRVETTLNDPTPFQVFRAPQKDPTQPLRWFPMRKGVADIKRRVEISHSCNRRYLDALAATDLSTPLSTLVGSITRPTFLNAKRVRGIRPWSPEDNALLRTAGDELYSLHGFRNRDLRVRLFPGAPDSDAEKRRCASRVTRMLRMLRAHALIRKIPHTHRYQLTQKGRLIIRSLASVQDLTPAKIQKLVA